MAGLSVTGSGHMAAAVWKDNLAWFRGSCSLRWLQLLYNTVIPAVPTMDNATSVEQYLSGVLECRPLLSDEDAGLEVAEAEAVETYFTHQVTHTLQQGFQFS